MKVTFGNAQSSKATLGSALFYAVNVTVSSSLIGLVVDRAWASFADGPWDPLLYGESSDLLFPAACLLVLTVARLILPPAPRWKAILVDSSLYLLTLLICYGTGSLVDGEGVGTAFGGAFFVALLSLFTLQLPAAWALIAWATGHLDPAAPRGEQSPASSPVGSLL
ncbi:hypothetical protein [Streptomyces cucumeris]|uniref:hypothetical protein n=1 Tax=Streptomyces cucumeris TaxID=2962890 RepID=UPI0020C911FB|nr:hypothetical protein [Streptomyces sp. NEAU-Y11]MCP9208607.1 hypothetical protein [Streptomyces sp. NEAU-Y11]